jgi:hypothetical protein
MLWAFDLLELNSKDLRGQTLDKRKLKLAKLLKGSRHHGIVLNEHLGLMAKAHSTMLAHSALRVLSQSDVTADTLPVAAKLAKGQEPESTRRPVVSGPKKHNPVTDRCYLARVDVSIRRATRALRS